MAVTHFVTQFTHVLKHPRFLNRKKKLFKENCFENVVLDLWDKKPIRPQNYFFLKVQ